MNLNLESISESKIKWSSIILRTSSMVMSDEIYNSLDTKERLLTFYYYHFDILPDHRAFVKDQLMTLSNAATLCFRMKKYQKIFHKIVDPVIEQAIQENSLKPIPLVDRSYFKIFWLQHLFLLRYWATDNSEDHENTIALIEKSIRSSFDFMSRGELKSSLDLWKFVFQNPIKLGMKYE